LYKDSKKFNLIETLKKTMLKTFIFILSLFIN
jgi:hypothetical protein